MSYVTVIAAELTTDPFGRGYSSMNAADAAADFNTEYRPRNRTSMTGSEVMMAINKDEFIALTPDMKQQVFGVLHMDQINSFGIEQDLFVDAFGGGSATITALAALRVESISRAEELGLGKVKPGHVEEARR